MHREKILEYLKKYKNEQGRNYSIKRIGVFGSVARNEITEDSDVDIVVDLEKADLFFMAGIKNDLETVFQRKIDIIRYNSHMNSFLKKRIDKEAYYV